MKLRIKVLSFIALTVLFATGCSQQTQQQAENAAQSMAADAEKNVKIAVEKTEEVTANAELTASVKSALMASKQIDTSNLNVDSQDGTIYLRGFVLDEEQKTLATEIAKNTASEGAVVVNELSIGNPTATPDAATATPDTASTPETKE